MKRASILILTVIFTAIFAVNSFSQNGKIIYGLRMDSLGNTFFSSINLNQGKIIQISKAPMLNGHLDMATIDPFQKQFYFQKEKEFYTIDIITGTVTRNVKITNSQSKNPNDYLVFYLMQFNCGDSLIYGLARINNDHYLATINPITGVIKNISKNSIFSGSFYAKSGQTIDYSNQTFYFVSQHEIIGLDMNTGSIKSSVTLQHPKTPNSNSFYNMQYNIENKQLYGIARNFGGGREAYFSTVNPLTGVVSHISTADIGLSLTHDYIGEISTIDTKNKIYYFDCFHRNVPEKKIVAVDMKKGNIIASCNMTVPSLNTYSFYSTADLSYCIGDTMNDETAPKEIEINFPNVFSPNSDEINDYFKPIKKVDELKEVKLSIYNRWGQKLFETDDLNSGWDGKYNGKECAEGTYYWILNYSNREKEIKAETGFFSLFK